jgi:hypothetical protein
MDEIVVQWSTERWDSQSELTSAIEKVYKAAQAVQNIPEISDAITDVCENELLKILQLLWIDDKLQVKKIRKPGIWEFEWLLHWSREDFIKQVYLDTTLTNYPWLLRINRRSLFIVIIKKYFKQNHLPFIQKEILTVINTLHAMSANTISLVATWKQDANLEEEMSDFIEAYISGENSLLLEIEEIY